MFNSLNAEMLADAVEEFERELPGFWWSVGYCRKGAHASCAVDGDGPQKHLLDGIEAGDDLDTGFHSDTVDGRPDEALRDVMRQAIKCLKERGLATAPDQGECVACQ